MAQGAAQGYRMGSDPASSDARRSPPPWTNRATPTFLQPRGLVPRCSLCSPRPQEPCSPSRTLPSCLSWFHLVSSPGNPALQPKTPRPHLSHPRLLPPVRVHLSRPAYQAQARASDPTAPTYCVFYGTHRNSQGYACGGGQGREGDRRKADPVSVPVRNTTRPDNFLVGLSRERNLQEGWGGPLPTFSCSRVTLFQRTTF